MKLTNYKIENLFLSTSLYKELDFPDEYNNVFRGLFIASEDLYFDAFCTHCGKESTFRYHDKYLNNSGYTSYFNATTEYKRQEYWKLFSTPILLTFECQREKKHIYSIMFVTSEKKLIKVGQYPAIAEIEQNDIKKYRKVLERDYNDFAKGIGLVSHGIGIGSFVYLRRIFENLIEENHQLAMGKVGWNEELYARSRMNEKIELLADYLPSILVESKQIYGIISKGIHELDEQECLDMFPHVKLAIELILDEKLFILEKEKKISTMKKFVQTKHSELLSR